MDNCRYKLLIDNALFGYSYNKIITDEKGTPIDYEIIEVNQAFEKLTGLKSAEIINRRISEIVPNIIKDDFNWISYFSEIALNNEVKEFEHYSKVFNRWYKVQASSHEKLYFSTVFIDISQEKEKEIELERFFSVNLDLLCIADRKGNFKKLNSEWEKTLGYSVVHLQFKNLLEFVHPEDIDDTLNAMKQLNKQVKIHSFKNRYKCKDGTYRYLEWRAYPYGNFTYAAARDITEHEKLVAELRDSRDEVSLLLNTIPTHIWYMKDPVTYGTVNHAHAKFMGLENQEIENKCIYKLLNKQAAEFCKEGNIKVFEEKKVYRTEEWVFNSQGERRLLEITKTPKLNVDGSVKFVVCSAEDITEQKYLQEKLILTNRQLRQVIDLVPAYIYARDVDGHYLLANKAIADRFNLAPEEVVGKKSKDFGAAEICFNKYLKEDNEVIKIGNPLFIKEEQYPRRDGSSGWFQTTKIPYKHPGCDKPAVLGISTDITEHKLLKDQLVYAKDQFEKLFTLSPAMKAIIKDDRCIRVNKAWKDNTGYSFEETMGSMVNEAPILKDLLPQLTCSREAVHKEKEKYKRITYTSKTHQQRTALVACEPLKINGSIQYLIVAIDITQLKQYEEEMSRLDRLNTIGQVASALAHEVRNPLTTIRGFTQLFTIKPEFRPYYTQLELVIDEIDRANQIISDFLSLAKTDKPTMKIASVIEEINEIIPLINAFGLEKDVSIKTVFKDVPSILVCINGFRQVLLNIVKNAIEASKKNDTVTISTYEEDSHVIVSIADEGTGVPEEIKDHIVEPFYTTKTNGTGLGLAVCNTILHRNAATMTFISSNLGTTFYLRFPIHEK